ncbi:hypothetical protein PINS_up008527 [Pythium insidiosum]|nr:hypothetical protein PINS_up008527 [Pythium insidiosum]
MAVTSKTTSAAAMAVAAPYSERSPLLAADSATESSRSAWEDDVESARSASPSASATPLASDSKTFMSAIIAFLGSGVLGFPYAFKETGLALGVALLVVVGALTAFCMLLLIECKYKAQQRFGRPILTYGEIGRAVGGATGEWLVNTSLVTAQAGFSVAYLIFISTNVHAYFDIPKRTVVLLCVPPLIAFSLIKHIRQLAFVALAADVLNFTGLAVVYATDFSYMNVETMSSLRLGGVLSSVPFFFGVATYCFAGVGMALPLENAMQHKTHFRRILLQTVALIATLYGSFGVCGYVAFGDATRDVITLNIDGHGGVATVVKLCLCAGLLCACPVMLFPVFEVLQPACGARDSSRLPVLAVRTLTVVAVAGVAGMAPSFGHFISFIGSTCCSFLGFVLPVVFYLRLHDSTSGEKTSVLRSRGVLHAISVVGMLAVLAGFYTTVSSAL